jgi:hypothetical protein
MREKQKERGKGMSFTEKLADKILPDRYSKEDIDKAKSSQDVQDLLGNKSISYYLNKMKKNKQKPDVNITSSAVMREYLDENPDKAVDTYKNKVMYEKGGKNDLILPEVRKGITMSGVMKEALTPSNWGGMAKKAGKNIGKSLIAPGQHMAALTLGAGMYLRDSAMLSDHKKDVEKRNEMRQRYAMVNNWDESQKKNPDPNNFLNYVENPIAQESRKNKEIEAKKPKEKSGGFLSGIKGMFSHPKKQT